MLDLGQASRKVRRDTIGGMLPACRTKPATLVPMARSLIAGQALLALLAALGSIAATRCAVAAPPPGRATEELRSFGIDMTAMAPAVDPCAEFYRYACGAWQRIGTQLASNHGYLAAFDGAQSSFRSDLQLLVGGRLAGASQSDGLRSAQQFYGRCEAALSESATPSAPPEFAAPDDMPALAAWVGRLQASGVHPFFRVAVEPDLRDGQRARIWLDEPPLGLGSRDAYLATDAAARGRRDRYAAYIRETLAVFAVPGAADAAQAVVDIETRLAAVSKSVPEHSNPAALFNPMNAERLRGLAPNLPWPTWRAALRAGDGDEWIVAAPRLLRELNTMWQSMPLVDLAAYVQWLAVRDLAPFAGPATARLADEWHQANVGGAAPTRADRCLGATLEAHGPALLAAWLAHRAGTAWHRDTTAVWSAVRSAVTDSVTANPWLDSPTRTAALGKLSQAILAPMLPPQWQVERSTSLVATMWSVRQQRFARELAQVGRQPHVGRAELLTGEVGSYFDPQRNAVFVAPAVLQRPVWPNNASLAVQYGGFGALVGHELIHAVDREGGYFNANGSLAPWWSAATAAGLASAATCLTAQMSAHAAVAPESPTPNPTIAELAADLGGVRAAHLAYRRAIAQAADLAAADRAFFVAYAQAWCAAVPADAEREMMLRGPHPPPRLRVQATVRNLTAFATAFGCKAGMPMAPKVTCAIW